VVTDTGKRAAGQCRRHRRQAGARSPASPATAQQQRPARPDRDLDLQPTRATALAGQQTNNRLRHRPGRQHQRDGHRQQTPPTTSATPPGINIVQAGQRPGTPTVRPGRTWLPAATVTFTYVVTDTGKRAAGPMSSSTDDKLRADHQLHRRHQQQRPARPDRGPGTYTHNRPPPLAGPADQHPAPSPPRTPTPATTVTGNKPGQTTSADAPGHLRFSTSTTTADGHGDILWQKR